MRKTTATIIVIVLLGGSLAFLHEHDYLQEYAHFMLIPMLGMYFLGQYVERVFRNEGSAEADENANHS